jgi:hypothetical protein
VARTIPSATRLLDVIPALDGDVRVQVVFTVNPGSAFGDGVAELLHDVGAKTIPWREARRRRFDLAIAATANGGLHRLRAPILLMPHGVGHNRLVRASTGSDDLPSGLAGSQLIHRGRVVPTAVALSHQEQADRLRRLCPPAAERAIVTGDPCFDRIVASLPARDRYRRALGVGHDQRLVVISSTWGERSLLGRNPTLLPRWVAGLPLDRYRLVLIRHPNVSGRHGSYEVERWLAEALNAGLALIPPQEGWRAALVAADWIIGDHGSVTYYGAALERPTLLAAFGADELDPASPLAAFGETRPRLDPARPLLDQLTEPSTEPPAQPPLPEALGMRGRALANLRDTMYRLMRLDPPPVVPRLRAVPPARPETREVTAMLVEGRVASSGRVVLDRYPATVEGRDLADPHLLVDEMEVDRRLLESATVFVRREPPRDPAAWARETFAAFPGAALAAAATGPGRCLVVTRQGAAVVAEGGDVALCASAFYVRYAAGLPIEGSVVVTAGPFEVRIDGTPPRPLIRVSRPSEISFLSRSVSLRRPPEPGSRAGCGRVPAAPRRPAPRPRPPRAGRARWPHGRACRGRRAVRAPGGGRRPPGHAVQAPGRRRRGVFRSSPG